MSVYLLITRIERLFYNGAGEQLLGFNVLSLPPWLLRNVEIGADL